MWLKIFANALLSVATISPSLSYADIITFDFSGLFSLSDSEGNLVFNQDAETNPYHGYRTEIFGSGSYNTESGYGGFWVSPFELMNATAVIDSHGFTSIGDGMGGAGNMMAVSIHFVWGGNNVDVANSTDAIWDASGFISNIPNPSSTTMIGEDCTGCATSENGEWTTEPNRFGDFITVNAVGNVPIAMTNYNSAFPLVDDGVAGIPMTEIFPGYNQNWDFTSMTITNTSVIPIPAAAWLFGSGLLWLVGVARRKKAS